MLMEAHEVGAYMRLLCYQWQQGSIPGDPAKIEKIAGVKHSKLSEVMAKFIPWPDGGLRNERMESIRDELHDFRELAKKGGKASGSQRTGNSDWGKEMAAKRKRTGSLGNNEPTTNSESTNRANTQSQSQSQSLLNLPFPSSAFADAWASWVKHRKEIKKPLTQTSIDQQLKQMAAMGEARAIRMIEHTIGKGWQGLAEPEQQHFQPQQSKLRLATA